MEGVQCLLVVGVATGLMALTPQHIQVVFLDGSLVLHDGDSLADNYSHDTIFFPCSTLDDVCHRIATICHRIAHVKQS